MIGPTACRGCRKSTLSIGSLDYAPLARMVPLAIMLLMLLIKPIGPYGSALVQR